MSKFKSQQQQNDTDKVAFTDNTHDTNHSSQPTNTQLADSPQADSDLTQSNNSNDTSNTNTFDLIKSINNRLLKIAENMLRKENAPDEDAITNRIDVVNENFNKIMSEIQKNPHVLNKVATIEHLKSLTSNICTTIETKIHHKSSSSFKYNNNKNNGNNKVLDWSALNDSLNIDDNNADHRQSIIVNESFDDTVVEMLKKFE